MLQTSFSQSPSTALLNAKGLLAVMVATLFSGQALAEAAGRVTFISGDVVAVSSDGNRRTLAKSDLVNSGERLETGKGRLQIRFTDGSFISLQPNTVFGLDNYTFARARPKEGTLLFNFIRGGMRTVSGAIGKVNRANYIVKTPVGTIGIRGTGYVATQEPNGRLLLSVNKGIVNVSNDFGNSNIQAGQTFQIEPNKAPEPAPQGVAAEVLANKPTPRAPDPADSEDKQESSSSEPLNLDLAGGNTPPNFAAADQTNNDGTPNASFVPFIIQSVNGVPRLSSFASLLKGSSNSLLTNNVLAAFDTVSINGQQVGNLVGLMNTKGIDDVSGSTLLLDVRRLNNPLQFAGVKQIRSLSFGEWTNGQASFVDNSLNITGLSLSATQFMPYIVGTTANKDLGNNQRISYSLANTNDATPARAGSSVGQLTKLNISIDLNLVPLINADLTVNIDNTNYTASVQNKAINLNLDKKLVSFSLSGASDNFFATSGDNNASVCANNGCPVTLSAFFSGVDLGAVYEINRPNNLASIGGVAVLTAGAPATIDIPSNRLTSTLDNSYTALFSNNAGINISPNPVAQLAAIFDNTDGGWRLGFHTATNNGTTSAIDVYGLTHTANNQASASASQITHVDKTLTWGVWSNGSVDVNDPVQDYVLTGQQQIHYILGIPASAAAIPNTNALHALYTFQGGTTPTINSSVISANIANSSYLDFDFGTQKVALNLDVNLVASDQSYLLNATGQTELKASNFNFDNLNVKLGAGNPCNTLGCSASVSGFLAGNTADWAALNYRINAVNSAINDGLFITTEGVAGFKYDATKTAPVATLADTATANYRALLTKQLNNNPDISVTQTAENFISARFDPNTLAWQAGTTKANEGGASLSYGLTNPNPSPATVAEVTHYKQTLSWGRWLNTDVNYGNTTITLGANDNVHYIVGAPTLTLPTDTAIVSYHFIGSTTPTGTLVTPTRSGSPATTITAISGVSVLNDSVVSVDFGRQNIGLNLGLTTNSNGDIRMTGSTALGTSFNFKNLSVTAGESAAASCSSCSANGFFAGTTASLIGLNYEVKAPLAGGNASIAGVAAFEK